MAQQFRILLEIYYRPHAAFCRVLDEGRFLFALLAAIVASVLFFGMVFSSVLPHAPVAAYGAGHHVESADPSAHSGNDEDQSSTPAPRPGMGMFLPLLGLLQGSLVLRSLMTLSGLYVPAAIVIVVLWDSLGGAATILRREYLPVLTCHLIACAATLLPLSLLGLLAPAATILWLPALGAGVLYFLFLSAVSLRAVLGTSGVRAAATVGAASAAAAFGGTLYGLVGSSAYYLASPFFLYYAYSFFQGDIRIIGSGLSSRQSLRRQLEAAKLNPPRFRRPLPDRPDSGAAASVD